jgi:hypothetical protein
MPGSSNNNNASFIPKRNTVSRERRGNKRQVYVGTILVRIAFIAVLLSVAAIFFYKNNLQKNLDAEVVGLSQALEAFNEADLQRVQLIDTKLKEVSTLMAHTVSTKTILEAVEASTLGSAQIVNFDMDRTGRETINISAQIEAPSFDAVVFQKQVYGKDNILTLETLKEISIESSEATGVETSEINKLGFSATLLVDAEEVPHLAPNEMFSAPAVVEEVPVETIPAEGTEVEGGEVSDSNEDIL